MREAGRAGRLLTVEPDLCAHAVVARRLGGVEKHRAGVALDLPPGRTTAVPAAVVRPLDAFKRTTLRPGARGTQVTALQRALGVRATGRMDAPTVAAVKKVQAAWRLRQRCQGNAAQRTPNKAGSISLGANAW